MRKSGINQAHIHYSAYIVSCTRNEISVYERRCTAACCLVMRELDPASALTGGELLRPSNSPVLETYHTRMFDAELVNMCPVFLSTVGDKCPLEPVICVYSSSPFLSQWFADRSSPFKKNRWQQEGKKDTTIGHLVNMGANSWQVQADIPSVKPAHHRHYSGP